MTTTTTIHRTPNTRRLTVTIITLAVAVTAAIELGGNRTLTHNGEPSDNSASASPQHEHEIDPFAAMSDLTPVVSAHQASPTTTGDRDQLAIMADPTPVISEQIHRPTGDPFGEMADLTPFISAYLDESTS